jgi:probable F420-dependent oxidoreductase
MGSPDAARFTRDALTGRVGVWRFASETDERTAAAIEEAGFASVWLGGGPSPALTDADRVLRATRRITVATGIVVIWRARPAELRAAWSRLTDRFGDRFLLGLGVGHQRLLGPRAEPPYSAMLRYLDELEAAGMPLHRVAIAALGPRMLRLAAERTAGAHPYLVDPAFTARARSTLGPEPLLVPEQRVVLGSTIGVARAQARRSLGLYLGLPNYTRNFARSGFTPDEIQAPGGDRLIDSLAAYDADGGIGRRIAAHLANGADQVALQLVGRNADDPMTGYAGLAAAAGLSS